MALFGHADIILESKLLGLHQYRPKSRIKVDNTVDEKEGAMASVFGINRIIPKHWITLSDSATGVTVDDTARGISILPGSFGTVSNTFIFALLPAVFIIIMSVFRKPSPAMIILGGISLVYIFNAIQSYLMLVADPDAAADVYTWAVGNLTTPLGTPYPMSILLHCWEEYADV